MRFEEIVENYFFSDGEITSFSMDFTGDSPVSISLKIRRPIKKQKFEFSQIILLFSEVTRVDIVEDFGTNGNYSDITLCRLHDGYYLSLDPYSNSGIPNENDNFVIEAKALSIIDENRISQIVS